MNFPIKLHGHPQKAFYGSEAEFLKGSAQGHWLINGELAHMHIDQQVPYLGEIDQALTIPFSIILHHFPGHVERVNAGYHSINNGTIIWEETGSSEQPVMIGDPHGDREWKGHYTVPVTPSLLHWWILQVTATAVFDNGDGFLVENLIPIWSLFTPTTGDVLESFLPFLGSRVGPIHSEAHPAAEYGTLTVEYVSPSFPLQPFDQPYPVACQFYSYTQHNITEPMTNEIRADLDLHHDIPGTTLFSRTQLDDLGLPAFVLDPTLLGTGQHKIALMRTEPNAEETAAALFVAFVEVGPGVPPPALVTVPNVLGQSAQMATGSLLAVGLSSTVTSVHDARPAGTVISQAPAGGAAVPPSTIVALGVSTGEGPDEVWEPATAEVSNTGGARLRGADGAIVNLTVKV